MLHIFYQSVVATAIFETLQPSVSGAASGPATPRDLTKTLRRLCTADCSEAPQGGHEEEEAAQTGDHHGQHLTSSP